MKRIIILCTLFFLAHGATAQAKKNEAYVDKSGVLRWRSTGKEVCAFGVNYTAMFAHAYRTAKRMNVDLEKAIQADVYHFSRLGFDAFRVHVWDTEISDTVGNLLNNEHLKLFDFALNEMKARGMKFILTPIAYWGNGYPEPDDKTPGFARKYGKDACLTNPDAIAAQEKYLAQFVDHVNPYTGVAYKDDSDIIAFEVSNEPHHRESPAAVTVFINKMVAAMRKSGCSKPIFYNISHSVHLAADAYFKSNIQGGTFQWYPTGLGARHELGGNFLPNVDKYKISFADAPGFNKMAKIVYEFDAADVGRSYIYPAMARAFREAGMQFASHFAYDPTYMAPFNTEYNTHYMNLVYAPQKALSLKIASEAFHELPLNKSYGTYPESSRFGNFRVSYEEDLAEMVTAEKFLYTNNTKTSPPSPGQLKTIAGAGTSPVVSYGGTGAYFLDKVEPGVWRLEVMPDAIWVRDPFTKASPHSEMAIVNWRELPMSVSLPDLGEGFSSRALNTGNNFTPKVSGKEISVRPGVYLLTRSGIQSNAKATDRLGVIQLGEFYAPEPANDKLYVVHEPPVQATEGKDLKVEAVVAATGADVKTVELLATSGRGRPTVVKMERADGYRYTCTIPSATVSTGYLQYYISATTDDGAVTMPGNVQGRPASWDFEGTEPYRVPVVARESPIYLFTAINDANLMTRQWNRGSYLLPGNSPSEAMFRVSVEKLYVADPENKNRTAIHDYSFRHYFGNQIAFRAGDLSSKQKIIVKGKALNGDEAKLQVALVMTDGSAFGGIVNLPVEAGEVSLSLSDLKRVKQVTLPRPYPTFLQYYFEGNSTTAFDIKKIESIQFSIGPGLGTEELEREQGVMIESVRLE